MSTNFYWIKEAKPACECCKRPYEEERLHIGKSSAGWCFSLHVMPDDGISTLDDWRVKWATPGSFIEDEYGDVLTPAQMLTRVTERGWTTPSTWTARDYEANHAAPGPKGLLRHRLDGRHCIGHGDGTYDYIVGEFS